MIADSEIKQTTYFADYIKHVDKNQHYNEQIQFEISDGVGEIVTAIARVTLDINESDTDIKIEADDVACDPIRYDNVQIQDRYVATFDCTEQITKAKQFKSEFWVNKNAKRAFVQWEIWYKNRPQSSTEVNVFGTEYNGGENGTTFLSLTENGNAINKP